MSALAHLMLQKGIEVTGSDIDINKSVRMLQKSGAEINIGHTEYVPEGIDLLVYSAAVSEDNPELTEARSRGIKTIKRGRFLADVAAFYETVISVAGSHGKTTVTSMIAHTFRMCGKNPDYVIGGSPAGGMPAAASGSGKYFITEADESDRSLSMLDSTIGIVINVEDDHSWSAGGKDKLFQAFKDFARQSKKLIYGTGEIADDIFSEHAEKYAMDFGKDRVEVPQPGKHNAFNAAVALHAAELCGIDSSHAKLVLSTFQGVSRRCTIHSQGSDHLIIEDYAHHPTELKCFLETLDESYSDYEKVIIFQPHRFERVENYGKDFAELLKNYEKVFITPPFAAWNKDKEHSTQKLAEEAGAIYFEGGNWEDLANAVIKKSHCDKPTVYAVIGAASVERVIPYLRNLIRLAELKKINPELELDTNLSWGDLTTLSIGSHNPLVATPVSEKQLKELLSYTHKNNITCLPLGCGSNMVGGDEAYNGIIIRMKNGIFSEMKIEDNIITAGAGVRLSRFVNTLAENEIGGAEALIAIPGSIGGALRMNAGAQDIETGDIVEEIHGVHLNGKKYVATRSEIDWWYRGSSIPIDLIITKARFRLQKVDKTEAKEKIELTRSFRKTTQPGGKNPGCAFRNPGNDSAGRLIDRYGLKNLTIGSCSVSDIHANFMVNTGGASEEDYARLLETVQSKIFDECGIVLKNEVVFSTGREITTVKALNIVVLKGGVSTEREISIISGTAVAGALRDGGHNVTEIDLCERELPAFPENTDVVFPVLHGEFGEDGQLQGLLDATGIPYVGTGKEASKITINKYSTSNLLRKNGIDTPYSQMLDSPETTIESFSTLPLIVKPNSQGSTIGMTLVKDKSEVMEALSRAFEVDTEVLIEEYIQGKETTVGLLEGIALPVVEIIPPDGFFDYDAKYTYAKGQTTYNCPPVHIPEEVQKEMQVIAEKCFDICKARDLLRVDMIWQPESNRIVVLEVNTMPGFTASSLLPKSAKAVGYSFTELCCMLAKKAFDRAR